MLRAAHGWWAAVRGYNKLSQAQVSRTRPGDVRDDFEGGQPWNSGGVEVNFPYFHHGNTYNDRWQWADCSARTAGRRRLELRVRADALRVFPAMSRNYSAT